MTKAQILLEPCTKCKAPTGEGCRPTMFKIGVHLERLLAAGGRIKEYVPRVVRRVYGANR